MITFEMTRDTISDGYVYLYRPDGERIAQSHNHPERVTYEIDEAGRWYIRIRHYSNAGTGTDALSLSDVGVDDHADDIADATLVVPDVAPIEGQIETRGDSDYFSFFAQAHHIYKIELARMSLSDGYIYLYAPDGETSLYASNTESVVYEFDDGGRYFFRVRHYQASGRGDYTVQITDLGLDDHADVAVGATPLHSLPMVLR